MTEAPQTLIVANQAVALRIDVWLTQHADLSRTQVQKLIKDGRITLNDQVVNAHHRVKNGDAITIMVAAEHFHEAAKEIPPLEPVILFEDDQYLVVNKPAGLVVHGGPGIHEPTLADWAVTHDPVIAQVGDQPQLRPGIVHRLDRDVSGVMVVAKTQPVFLDLKRQFQNHSITKIYVALVYGRLETDTGRIEFAIARSPSKSGLMVARPKSQEGRQAETHFDLVRAVKNMSLVRVQTLTGRTHQIRVHFKAIGHPLVGDPLYRIKRLKNPKTPPSRLFLHAQLLGFDDLRGERRQYEAPLPRDLEQYLARVS